MLRPMASRYLEPRLERASRTDMTRLQTRRLRAQLTRRLLRPGGSVVPADALCCLLPEGGPSFTHPVAL